MAPLLLLYLLFLYYMVLDVVYMAITRYRVPIEAVSDRFGGGRDRPPCRLRQAAVSPEYTQARWSEVMPRFACPYLGDPVEMTEERERHIAEKHPDLLPEHKQRIINTATGS